MMRLMKLKIRNLFNMKKIILIHYLNVGNMAMADYAVYKDNYFKALPKSDDVINYIVPIRGETKVECVNPVLLTDDEYAKAKIVLERNQKVVEELVTKFKGK